MNKAWQVIQYRGFNDFKYGSFILYVTEKEVMIRGILKKANNYSSYMLIKNG